MRAGPLSNPSVGDLLEEDFVSAWEKKGAVECYRVKGASEKEFKVGGNILTYVCTPKGEVVHALPRTWTTWDYLWELSWARDLFRETAGLGADEARARIRAAHAKRAEALGEWKGAAHRLLATHALRPLADVEKEFYETLLHQTYQPEKDIVIRELSPGDFQEFVDSAPTG